MSDQTPDLGSLRSTVQAARARQKKQHTIDLEIPGYDGTLWATFRALDDYKENRAIGERHQDIEDDASRELAIAADTLVVSCVDCFVPQEGFKPGEDHDKFSLGMTLGVELAKWLELDGADNELLNDVSALFLIFPSTLQLASTAGSLGLWAASIGRKVDRRLEGNSLAPSL